MDTGAPIDVAAIAAIGSCADPVERNQRITTAYESLSTRLCHFIGGPFANWCTYAVWSSRTVGGAIAATDLPTRAQEQLRRLVPDSSLRGAIEARLRAGLPTTRRTVGIRLGEGNRAVFVEVATHLVRFLDQHHADVTPEPARLEHLLATVEPLDDSGTMSAAPIDDLRDAIRWYYRARFASTGDERSEQVLAGSLLLGTYEQTRLQRPIDEAFALGVDGLLGPIERGVARLPVPWPARVDTHVLQPVRARLTPWWARLMTTRTMTLQIDGDVISLGDPLGPAPGHPLTPPTLEQIASPQLRDLLHQLRLDDDQPVVARDWSSFDDRMRFIGAFFRSRQQDGQLFAKPDVRGRW